jgi:ATP synthase F1 complex assembly factor 1
MVTSSRRRLRRKLTCFNHRSKLIASEGVRDLEELKRKVVTPSVAAALKAKRRAEEYRLEEQEKASRQLVEEQEARTAGPKAAPKAKERVKKSQSEGDRAGIKVSQLDQPSGSVIADIQPLGSIINLPLIHLTPHDEAAIAKIWTTYHSTHPTLSNSFLSASVPTKTYETMISLAKPNPFFVIPLPRSAGTSNSTNQVKTDEYEMFVLQWLFHPTPESSGPSTGKTLPSTASAIFTPLEEYKKQGEWAQPYLVLTHYPDLAHSHGTVLMRGEISTASAGGPDGSDLNPGYLLSQPQAQLLALALQRFYCAGVEVKGEGAAGTQERLKRIEALTGFRERPEEFDWTGLVSMAYGGLM